MANGKIFKLRASSAPQCRIGIDQKIRFFCQGGKRTGFPLQYLHASSLSICSRSEGHWEKETHTRFKECFYGQAVTGSDPKAPAACKINWANHKRNSDPGSGSFTPQGSGEWLKRKNRIEQSSWNTALTDCPPKKWFKFISFWYRTRDVLREM